MNVYYNHYHFDPTKEYLIYFRGCFCPPTKGHFSLLKAYIHLPNVRYFIHQMGSEKRHGVPYWLNRKIWKIYISSLLAGEKHKIILEKMGPSLDILDQVDNIDQVILIKGNEGMDRREEKEMCDRYGKLRRQLRKRGKDLHFLVIDRPELNNLSATKFIEAVNNNHSAYDYMPDELSIKKKKYIISNLYENIP